VADIAAKIKVGPGLDPSTEMGPLVSDEQFARVTGYIEDGRQSGAKIAVGGDRVGNVGYFVVPTVFENTTPDMKIITEEIFGPVVCVTPFESEEEAVQLANATNYGLAAYLWTSDLRRAHRVAALVESGMTWVNSHNVRDLRTPFGGVKNSGLGREGGQHSIEFYTESRIVHVALGDTHVPRFGA
jgi:5-carboxymethyl-2-hydroxymuconic-semialdehyde dehydrogenase